MDPMCPYISSVFCSSVLWWLTRKGERGAGTISPSIILFHLGHKVAATLGLVHGSICLILETGKEKKLSDVTLGYVSVLKWVL